MSTMSNRVGIPWYRVDEYKAVLAIMVDRDRLPATHAEWLRRAEQVVKEIEGQGGIPIKAYIDPQTFASWCRNAGEKLDSSGRTKYATWVAFQTHVADGSPKH